MAIKLPKKQQQCLIPKYLLDYTTELNENHPDPTDPWGGSGGDVNIEAGTGITITTESDDTKVISLDTTPSTFEVTASTGMTLEVENQNPLWKDSKLQMTSAGSTRLEGTLIDIEANNIYLHSNSAPYYVNNTTHEYKTLATTDQLFSGNYNDLSNKPTIPDAVSGTNDGTNWTSLTIGEDTYGLASGGTTYTAGTGIDITGSTISVDTSVIAEVSDIPTDLSDLNNDVGYITGINSSDVTTALGYTPYNSSNPDGYITGINSSDVITALGYTPGTSNFSGSYNDLSNKPTIPTATSDLTNDSGFITNSDQNVEYIFITSTSSTPSPFTLTNDQIDAIVLNPTKYIIVYDYQPTLGEPRIYFRYQYQSGSYFYYASLDYYKDAISISGVNGYRDRKCQFTLTVSGTNKGTITMTNANQDYQKMLTTGTGISMSGNEISVNTGTIATRTWVGNQGYLTSSDISNMVTTDTDQTITANKVFQGNYDIRLQSGATYTSSDTLITNDMISASQIGGTLVSAGELVFADSTTQQNSQIRVRDFTQTPFVDYRIEVPTKNGTMALTSDIPTKTSDLTNDSGYITGINSSDVTTALGFTPYNSSNPDGYITGITSSDVTTALGYTPTNPSSLATVATSGSYNDLSNKPTIPTVPVRSDSLISVQSGFTNRYTKVMYDQQNGLLTLVAQWYNDSGSSIAANTTLATINSSITVPFNQYYYPGLNQGTAASIKLELATGRTIKNGQSWGNGTTLTISWVLNIS